MQAPMEWFVGSGIPLSSRLGGLRSIVIAPKRGMGAIHQRFLRFFRVILCTTEHVRTRSEHTTTDSVDWTQASDGGQQAIFVGGLAPPSSDTGAGLTRPSSCVYPHNQIAVLTLPDVLLDSNTIDNELMMLTISLLIIFAVLRYQHYTINNLCLASAGGGV